MSVKRMGKKNNILLITNKNKATTFVIPSLNLEQGVSVELKETKENIFIILKESTTEQEYVVLKDSIVNKEYVESMIYPIIQHEIFTYLYEKKSFNPFKNFNFSYETKKPLLLSMVGLLSVGIYYFINDIKQDNFYVSEINSDVHIVNSTDQENSLKELSEQDYPKALAQRKPDETFDLSDFSEDKKKLAENVLKLTLADFKNIDLNVINQSTPEQRHMLEHKIKEEMLNQIKEYPEKMLKDRKLAELNSGVSEGFTPPDEDGWSKTTGTDNNQPILTDEKPVLTDGKGEQPKTNDVKSVVNNISYLEEKGKISIQDYNNIITDKTDKNIYILKMGKHTTNEKHLVVFADPTCPNCRKMQAVLSKLLKDGYAITEIPVPAKRGQGMSNDVAVGIIQSVACSSSPAKTWIDWMSSDIMPKIDMESECSKDKKDIILKNLNKFYDLQLEYVPTLIKSNGDALYGFYNYDETKKWLEGN